MEFMIRDRLSWMRFLRFDLDGPTPDENRRPQLVLTTRAKAGDRRLRNGETNSKHGRLSSRERRCRSRSFRWRG